MPLGPNTRYRVKKQGGRNVRLAFQGNRVVEATDIGPAKPKRKVRLRTSSK